MNRSGLLPITINYEENDYIVNVDQQTACTLLNDYDQAREYMRQFLAVDNEAEQTQPQRLMNNTEIIILSEQESGSCDSESTNQAIVWSSKKPSTRDHEATVHFLQLREQYNKQFDDKKTVKNQLWSKIASDMNNEGYYVGTGKEAIEKCRRKFANLQKQYINYIKHLKSTGVEKKDPPPFFDELNRILGCKDKVYPTNTQDSFGEIENVVSIEDKENIEIDDNPHVKNRFCKCKRSIVPKSTNVKLIELLQTQHEQNREDRHNQFKSLEALLLVQNEQREKLIKHFETLVNTTRKRKKHDISSESDD